MTRNSSKCKNSENLMQLLCLKIVKDFSLLNVLTFGVDKKIRGIFGTLSHVYDGDFLRKELVAFSC